MQSSDEQVRELCAGPPGPPRTGPVVAILIAAARATTNDEERRGNRGRPTGHRDRVPQVWPSAHCDSLIWR